MLKSLTLVLGGARSGKSDFAQAMAAQASNVLFVATAEAGDAEMASRIREHQRSRPSAWKTLEEPRDLERRLPSAAVGFDMIALDCLTLWVSNLLIQESPAFTDMEILERARALAAVYQAGTASWVVVSNEAGLGVVPPTVLGRRYRDVLGRVNQVFGEAADHVYLLVAGMALDLTALGAKPWRRALGQGSSVLDKKP